MLTFDDASARRGLAERTGSDPDLSLLPFPDLEEDRAPAELIRSDPWTKEVPIHGLVYEVETGRLRQVG